MSQMAAIFMVALENMPVIRGAALIHLTHPERRWPRGLSRVIGKTPESAPSPLRRSAPLGIGRVLR